LEVVPRWLKPMLGVGHLPQRMKRCSTQNADCQFSTSRERVGAQSRLSPSTTTAIRQQSDRDRRGDEVEGPAPSVLVAKGLYPGQSTSCAG